MPCGRSPSFIALSRVNTRGKSNPTAIWLFVTFDRAFRRFDKLKIVVLA